MHSKSKYYGLSWRVWGGSLSGQLLLNQGNPTPKKLYIVSKLCGHVDPKETLNTYFHLLDWMLLHARNRQIPRLGITAQSSLLDLTPNALKVFRSRHKIPGENLLLLWQHRLKRPEGLKRELYRDPLLQAGRSVSTLLQPGSVHFKCSELQPPTPMLLYRILRMHHRGFRTTEIAERFGFRLDQINFWINSAKHLGTLRTRRGKWPFASKGIQTEIDLDRYPALPGLSPAPPRRSRDRQEADALYRRVLQLAEMEESTVIHGLRLFLGHVVPNEGPIRFRRMADQRAWVTFLKGLVSTSRLRLTLFPHPETQEKKQRAHWSRMLGIPKAQILTHPTEISKRSWGRVDVWVAQKANPVLLPKSQDVDSWPDPGLKFALFMAAVYLGFRMEKNEGSANADPPLEMQESGETQPARATGGWGRQ